MSVQISHDGFTRTAIYREKISEPTYHDCRNCGATPKTLYRYAIHNDDDNGRVLFNGSRTFCSIGCWRAYHMS